MIEEGAYGILEPEDYGLNLNELSNELNDGMEALDSRFSTISGRSNAYTGGLVIKAGKNTSRTSVEKAESILNQEIEKSNFNDNSLDIALQLESHDLDNKYYSVRNLTGALEK